MIWYVLIGLISGIVSGMGIGGGTILIPGLCIFFGINQQTAQNINLIYFIPTAIVALITHIKDGNVEKKAVTKLVLFGFLAAAIGSFIAVNADSAMLRKMFGYFLLVMGLFEFFHKEKIVLNQN